MYIDKDKAAELLREVRMRLSERIGKHDDFLKTMAEGDDWSFVIKAHALVEAAVTNLLALSLGEEKIYPILERLPLSDNQTGKIAIARQLGLLSPEQRKFVRWFSELRNTLVHKVENVSFIFSERWSTIDSAQRKAWVDAVSWSRETKEIDPKFAAFVEKAPKLSLQVSVFTFVAVCELDGSKAAGLRAIASESEKTTTTEFDRQKELIDAQSNLIAELLTLLEEKSAEDHD